MDDVWMDLLNSDWHDHRGSGRSEDRLENQQWLQDFLSPLRETLSRSPFSEIKTALRELRSLIQRMVNTVISGRKISQKDQKLLNSVLSVAPIFHKLVIKNDKYQLELVHIDKNIKSVIAEIALSFSETLVHGDATRIKICENTDCRWVFYDKSRSRTRRWCEGETCGNLMKVRRFRAKKKKSESNKKIQKAPENKHNKP